MSVVFNLKNILVLIIFVIGGNREHKNGALNVVYVDIFSYYEEMELYHSGMRGLLTTSPI